MNRSFAALLATSCLVGITTSAAAAPSDWKAGVARLNITPAQPMWMSGYGGRDKPAEGKLTDLWAKALVLEDPEGKRAAVITMDLVGIDRELSAKVAQEVQRRFKMPRECLILSTSHTHTGPVVGSNLRAMYFFDQAQQELVRGYASALQTNLVKLTGDAIQNLQPVRITWGCGHATFAANRRNNREADIGKLRASGGLQGPVDHDVPVLAVWGADNRLKVVLCGYACHATVLSSYEWSGDWPGFAQIALEERHPGATAMIWAGCGADQNPLPRRQVSLAREYGVRIAEAADAVVKHKMQPVTGPLTATYAEIPLPFAHIPSAGELQQSLQSTNRYETNRAVILSQRLQAEGKLAPNYPYPVQVWRLGAAPHLIALGGEVVVDYALRLKAEFGAHHTWVMGYANDVMAYIPSRRVLDEGGYEGGGAMVFYGQPSPWAPEVEELIVAEVRKQIIDVTPRHPTPDPLVVGPNASPASTIARPLYHEHGDLTVYLDQANRPQIIKTNTDWEQRRAQIKQGMLQAMGQLPDPGQASPLDVQVKIQSPSDGYTVAEISYASDRSERVPALLLVPEGRVGKLPAMLCLHQTTPLGKKEPAGLGTKTNLHYARELARRGYICIVPDYPSFGDHSPYDFAASGHPSGTMRGIINHMRAVDVLCQRADVDPERIGVIGHSLGGHNAMFVAVFDPRLKVIVASCGWTPFQDYYDGNIAGWTSDRYMPRLRTAYALDPRRVPFDFYEVVAALAPRAFFSNSPLHDGNFSVEGVRKAEARAGRIYRLLGAADRLLVRYPDCGHDFPPEIREETYTFIDRHLNRE